MSDIINAAVSALTEKLGDDAFDGSAKFVIEDEGSVVIDGDGVRASDDDTDVTMTADAETFQAILEGELNPTAAFMPIAHYFAFYPSRVDACYVGEEQVTAQSGDFYGGWITSKIIGPFKGGPGTLGW